MKKFIIASLIIISIIFGANVLAKTYITGYDVNNNYEPVKVERGIYVQGISLYPSPNMGENIPNVVASFETSLAAKISSSATSMTLVSGTTDDGTTLNGLYGFVIDEGGSNQEFVLATCVNTSCTGMTRGISTITGTSSVAALQKEHRRGASVKITDHPVLATIIRLLNGQGTLLNNLTINGMTIGGGTITGLTSTPLSSATSSVANVNYVNSVATSGVADASEVTSGKSELSTGAEAAAGTAYGTTGSRLSLPGSLATSTPSANISIPVTNSSGKLSQSFLDLTASFTFTGSVNSGMTGEIKAYASSSVPTGWLACSGQIASTTSYASLFAIIGYTYGGSGTNFYLPDLRGKNILGYGSSTPAFDVIGEIGGATTTTLTTDQMPAHTHTIDSGAGGANIPTNSSSVTNTTVPSTVTSNSTGGGQSHSNMDPFIVLQYIIKY